MDQIVLTIERTKNMNTWVWGRVPNSIVEILGKLDIKSVLMNDTINNKAVGRYHRYG